MSRPRTKTLRLILGDQLNARHAWFRRPDPSVLYVIMEMRQETDYVRQHVQKVCAFFAAMRAFARHLEEKGHRVECLRLDDPANAHDLGANIEKLLAKHRVSRFEYMLPDEYRLDRQLAALADKLPCETHAVDSEHFLTSRGEVAEFFGDRKQFRMESFYRHMRRTHDVLMTGDEPEGGRWNFDIENRSKYTGQVPLVPPRLFANDVSDIVGMLERSGVQTLGRIEPAKLIWPVTRKQSQDLLSHFIRKLLPHFGTYEDAMTMESWTLYHSRLSFALNTKQLHPVAVIDRAIAEWRKRPDEISLPQIEGFVRQILGWREYMRGLYWHAMPEWHEMNFLRHSADLPRYYWDGQTRMNCMAQAIGQSLEFAYAHHIQRLMITGNFALLAGVEPAQVDAWYLGIYIDAIEWVELPNTRGMSQFADGGLTASKPYVSSANYIHSMSDYCGECHYERKRRHGERACPFNSLHWDFYARHRKQLAKNPRVATMYRVWDRMDAEEQKRVLKQARAYRKQLDEL
jgi:deoxyribodipyrimidine photolyase-related protein